MKKYNLREDYNRLEKVINSPRALVQLRDSVDMGLGNNCIIQTNPLPKQYYNKFDKIVKSLGRRILESNNLTTSGNLTPAPMIQFAMLKLFLGNSIFPHLIRDVPTNTKQGTIPFKETYFTGSYDREFKIYGGQAIYENDYTSEFLSSQADNSAIVTGNFDVSGGSGIYGTAEATWDVANKNYTVDVGGGNEKVYKVAFSEVLSDKIATANKVALLIVDVGSSISLHSKLSSEQVSGLNPLNGAIVTPNNIVLANKIFTKYFKEGDTETLESNEELNTFATRVRQLRYDCKTNKVRGKLSAEFLLDSQTMYNFDAFKGIIEDGASMLQGEMDRRAVKYLKENAKTSSTLDLNTVNSNSLLQEAKYTALMTRALFECNEIRNTTKVQAGNVILVSPAIASGLTVARGVGFSSYDSSSKNPETLENPVWGTLHDGRIKVVVDHFAREHFGGDDFMLTTFLNETASNDTFKEGLIKATYVPLEYVVNVDRNNHTHILFNERSAFIGHPYMGNGYVRMTKIENANLIA